MKTSLRKMGNSHGVIIPKALIAQFNFEGEIEMTVTDKGIVLEKPKSTVRQNWAEASQALAKSQDDALVWPDLANADDDDLTW